MTTLTSSCNDTVDDEILSISCVEDTFFTWTTTKVDAERCQKMDYANLVLKSILCSFLLHFVPRDTDLYELSHIYACSLASDCIWQMGEVSRRLKRGGR